MGNLGLSETDRGLLRPKRNPASSLNLNVALNQACQWEQGREGGLVERLCQENQESQHSYRLL